MPQRSSSTSTHRRFRRALLTLSFLMLMTIPVLLELAGRPRSTPQADEAEQDPSLSGEGAARQSHGELRDQRKELVGSLAFASPADPSGFASFQRGAGIVLRDLANDDLRILVDDFQETSSPRWSPDQRWLAFAGRRNANWDIYLVDAKGSGIQRLTRHPGFDDQPAWSPDGASIAFTSYRDGDLEIYCVDLGFALVDEDRTPLRRQGQSGRCSKAAPAAERGKPIRLTEHPGPDIDAEWMPSGEALLISRWYRGRYAIFGILAERSEGRLLLEDEDGRDLRHARVAPDGRQVAIWSSQHAQGAVIGVDTSLWRSDSPPWQETAPREGDLRELELQARRLPGSSQTLAFDWSGGSSSLVVLQRRVDAQAEERRVLGPLDFQDGGNAIESPSPLQPSDGRIRLPWSESSPDGGITYSSRPPDQSLPRRGQRRRTSVEAPGNGAVGRGFIKLDLETPGPRIHPSLLEDFEALRRRIDTAAGRDFLGQLSDLWRPLDANSAASAYFSWHKVGRAFDTLLEWPGPGGRRDMFLIREDRGAETYWRMQLRSLDQDGSAGRPLYEPNWWYATGDALGGARATLVPRGYFVDFSQISEAHGWYRIPSFDVPEFSWKSDWRAIEYWHYERRDGLSWLEAISEVQEEDAVLTALSEDRLRELGISEAAKFHAGVLNMLDRSDTD